MVVRAELPARPVRRQRRLRRRPGVAAAHLQLDRRQPRRQALDRQGPRRRRRPQRQDDAARTSTAILDLDFAKSEIEQGEYVRFMYHRAGSNALMVVRPRPARSGWPTASSSASSTRRRTPAIPVTDFKVQVDWYKNSRLVVGDDAGDRATGSFTRVDRRAGRHAVRHVLGRDRADERRRLDGRPGLRRGRGDRSQDADGQHHRRARSSAAPAVANAQSNLLYNNGSVFGANDWTLAAPSPVTGGSSSSTSRSSRRRARCSWPTRPGTTPAPYTDLDTLILGRSANHFQLFGGPSRSARRTSSTRSARARTRTSGPASGSSTPRPAGRATSSPRPRRRACTRSRCTRSAGTATSSTCRSRSSSAARR